MFAVHDAGVQFCTKYLEITWNVKLMQLIRCELKFPPSTHIFILYFVVYAIDETPSKNHIVLNWNLTRRISS